MIPRIPTSPAIPRTTFRWNKGSAANGGFSFWSQKIIPISVSRTLLTSTRDTAAIVIIVKPDFELSLYNCYYTYMHIILYKLGKYEIVEGQLYSFDIFVFDTNRVQKVQL